MMFNNDYRSIFSALNELLKNQTRVVAAIDGSAASGKTTLANMLSDRYGAAVIHMDDFFLRPEQRMPERFAEAGGNIDRERFLKEVIPFLKEKRAFSYQRFDCKSMMLGDHIHIPETQLIVVEGSYSLHPAFTDYYDLSIFLSISEKTQKERIEMRNGAMAEMFFSHWIPLENTYFDSFQIKTKADIVITC